MNSRKILKIKIGLILHLINLLKKMSYFIFWFLEKVGQGLGAFLFLILKITIFLFSSSYLRIKKITREFFSQLHYQSGLFSLFSQPKIVPLYLILIFVFIIAEGKTMTVEEKFLTKAFNLPKEREIINPDFKMAVIEESEEAILKPNLTFDREFIPTRTEIEEYVVEKGDTISSIAEDFGLSVNTILWENKLTARSIIKPGQVLKILPVSGVSHKVKKGETVEKIARLYRAEKENIINFNNLEEEPLRVGDLIIIPEGKIPPPPSQPRVFVRKDKTWPFEIGEKTRQGINCRTFAPGYCTYYVAQKYCIPWSGHAKSWLANARKFGYATGNEPKKGAIISLKETWYGHVGIVEEVKENSVIISEMNHLGRWKVNKREINKDDWRINGYVYLQ